MAPSKQSASNLAAHERIRQELRAFALSFPATQIKSPWPGHLDVAVRDKTFVYLNIDGEPLRISCKLPDSQEAALQLEHVTLAAYGLGKSGWVSANFPEELRTLPVAMLRAWIEESYRAQAPKSVLKELDAAASLPPQSRKKSAKRTKSSAADEG